MVFNRRLFFIIVLAACLTQIAANIYTPSMVAIAESFDSSLQWVQWTMVSYIFGVAVSQLFFGPLSEGIGRRKPIIIGFVIMSLASLLALFSPNIQCLMIARLIQGIGAGACAGLWRSIVRDVLSGEQLAKYSSYFVMVTTFIVPASPIVGAYLQDYFGWQSSFIFITLYALFALFSFMFGFAETNAHHHPNKLKWSFVKENYTLLFKSRLFMGVALCTFLSYGILFASVTVFPILLIHHLEMDPVRFSWLSFMGTGLAYVFAGYTNSKLVRKLGVVNMMRIGFAITVSGGVFLYAASLTEMSIWNIAIPIFIINYGLTFIWPNAFALGFTPFGHIAGYAGSLYGFMQICGGAVLSGVISFLPNSNPTSLAMIAIGSGLLAWFILEVIKKDKHSHSIGMPKSAKA